MNASTLEPVRQALLTIAMAHGGVLPPHAVVDAARADTHVLHQYFEWDDAVASEAYRLVQAGTLIRRMRITVLRTSGESRTVQVTTTRAFQSRPSQRRATGGYETVAVILTDPDKRAELLTQVLAELLAIQRRYRGLVELQDVWTAIEEAAVLVTTGPAPATDVHPSDSPPTA